MSDRIAVFHQGRIQQIDTPAAIYEQPANAFVARFIGENNRVSGTVEHIDASRCAVRAAGGAVLAGTCGATLMPGAQALLSVRPERIVLGGASTDCALDGTLAEAIYLGDHLRLRVAVPALGDIIVKSHSANAPALGAAVRIGWRAEHCRVFPLERDG